MKLEILLLGIFIVGGVSAWMLLLLSHSLYRDFKHSIIDRFDRFTTSHFLFISSDKLFKIYALFTIITPCILMMAGFSLMMCALVFILILLVPNIAIRILAKHRSKDIVAVLPDTLQQLGGALRAGATLNGAVQAMVSDRNDPIAQEFTLMLREQRMGIRVEDSLENLADRINSEDVDIAVSAILIAQDVGGDLAEVLIRLSSSLRSKIGMEERIRSLTAQGVVQGYVVTALPTIVVLVLLLVEREATLPLFTTLLGWIFLFVVISLQVCGGWFIRKIVEIDI